MYTDLGMAPQEACESPICVTEDSLACTPTKFGMELRVDMERATILNSACPFSASRYINDTRYFGGEEYITVNVGGN